MYVCVMLWDMCNTVMCLSVMEWLMMYCLLSLWLSRHLCTAVESKTNFPERDNKVYRIVFSSVFSKNSRAAELHRFTPSLLHHRNRTTPLLMIQTAVSTQTNPDVRMS